jgi:AcrR family transcriptional regulator
MTGPPRRSQPRPHDFPVRPTMRSPAPELGPRATQTIAKILWATKAIFLARGYAGTTIDEITRVAGVSRGSFYTYFPSKRDALLALGADSIRASRRIVGQLRDLPDAWTDADLESFVERWFELLEEYGSFAFAWTQAAHEDNEIRVAGMKTHLQLCRELGLALAALRGQPFDDPTAQGVVIVSMLERGWAYCQLYTGKMDAADVRRTMAQVLAAITRCPARRRP